MTLRTLRPIHGVALAFSLALAIAAAVDDAGHRRPPTGTVLAEVWVVDARGLPVRGAPVGAIYEVHRGGLGYQTATGTQLTDMLGRARLIAREPLGPNDPAGLSAVRVYVQSRARAHGLGLSPGMIEPVPTLGAPLRLVLPD